MENIPDSPARLSLVRVAPAHAFSGQAYRMEHLLGLIKLGRPEVEGKLRQERESNKLMATQTGADAGV